MAEDPKYHTYTPITRKETLEKCERNKIKIAHSVQPSYTFFLPRLHKAVNWPIEPRRCIKDLRLETDFGQVEWMFKNFRHYACNLPCEKKKNAFKLLAISLTRTYTTASDLLHGTQRCRFGVFYRRLHCREDEFCS